MLLYVCTQILIQPFNLSSWLFYTISKCTECACAESPASVRPGPSSGRCSRVAADATDRRKTRGKRALRFVRPTTSRGKSGKQGARRNKSHISQPIFFAVTKFSCGLLQAPENMGRTHMHTSWGRTFGMKSVRKHSPECPQRRARVIQGRR